MRFILTFYIFFKNIFAYTTDEKINEMEKRHKIVTKIIKFF